MPFLPILASLHLYHPCSPNQAPVAEEPPDQPVVGTDSASGVSEGRCHGLVGGA